MTLENLPKEIIVAVFGLVLIVAGVIFIKNSQTVAPTPEVMGESNQIDAQQIYIDISGAIAIPGVYKMDSQARVEDVLNQAGGLTADADAKYIETSLNRAAKLTDGQKIYVPRKGEEKVQSTGYKAQGKININAGSQAELEALPGIGPATAVKIIAGRGYSRIEDLLTRKIVTAKVFTAIKDSISVW